MNKAADLSPPAMNVPSAAHPPTAGVILAAGASTRFGRPKQLLDWHGVPLVAHIADVALAAGLNPVIVVLGCQAEAVRPALEGRNVQMVMNWRWEAGLSTSLQVGLAALPPTTAGAVLLHCDQPLLTAGLLRALMAKFAASGAPLVYPVYDGQHSPPVLFARRLFPELAAIGGDEGGRSLVLRYAAEAASVAVSDPQMLADVDTPADYERLRRIASPAHRSLGALRHLIVDMDGVLWHGDRPLPGLHAFFAFLRRRAIEFVLATNNSSLTPKQYAAKLARFGVDVPVERILNSSQATAAYLTSVASPGACVYAIGEQGVREALEEQGFTLAGEDGAGARYVVVGWDRNLTWQKLATATLLIHNERAVLIGTNPDRTYPTERGLVPGNGAQLAALQAATGVVPLVIGKPEPWLYEEAMRRMGARPETTGVLGDRLDTDIPGGVRLGLFTILVLSGIATANDLATSPLRPDVVCAGLEELVEKWENQITS